MHDQITSDVSSKTRKSLRNSGCHLLTESCLTGISLSSLLQIGNSTFVCHLLSLYRLKDPLLCHQGMAQVKVQAIASMLQSKDTIPPEFVRMEDEQPGATTYRGPAPAVPVIDLADTDRVVDAIADASREWGIFQLVNHGIPAAVIGELQRVGREFFELPQEEKEAYAADPRSGSIEGYGTQIQKDPNGKKAWGDYLFHNVWPPSRINHGMWPRQPSSYRYAYSFLLSQLTSTCA